MIDKAPSFLELIEDPARLQAVAAALREMREGPGYGLLVSMLQRAADTASRAAVRSAGKECSLEYASALIAVSDSIPAHVDAVIARAEQVTTEDVQQDRELSRMSFGGGSPAI